MNTGSRLPWVPSLDLLLHLKTSKRWAILITASKDICSRVKQGIVRGNLLAQIAVAVGQMLDFIQWVQWVNHNITSNYRSGKNVHNFVILFFKSLLLYPRRDSHIRYKRKRGTYQKFWKEHLRDIKSLFCGCDLNFFTPARYHFQRQHINCHWLFSPKIPPKLLL